MLGQGDVRRLLATVVATVAVALLSPCAHGDFAEEVLAARREYVARLPELERSRDAELAKVARDDWRRRGDIWRRFHRARVRGFRAVYERHPVEMDWLLQDDFGLEGWLRAAPGETSGLAQAVRRAASEAGVDAEGTLRGLEGVPGDDPRWLRAFVEVARRRRAARLRVVSELSPEMVFIRRAPVTPSFFAYTEGLSDAQSERFFKAGTELVRLSVGADGSVSERSQLKDEGGMMRDPDVSFDATRLLFSWKRADRTDDYHLYEYELSSGKVRQLTFGLGVADFEGIYAGEDDIIFSSTRPVQTVDCYWTEVSNLYACDRNGEHIRRLGFDQVHTVYPQLLPDGSVVYTRWDYNDRGQMFTQALFRMNVDGTGQTELYGNNSWFPTTPCHARPIPGTNRLLAVAMGHHTWQAGKLIVIDPSRGRQEAEGVEYFAPRSPAKSVRIDAFGQHGTLYRHPYPLDERHCLASVIPGFLNEGDRSGQVTFSLCYVREDGAREVLSHSTWRAANHVRPLLARPVPHRRPSVVDYRREDGAFYVHDVYAGPAMAGVRRGKVKALRVVALEFRAAGCYSNKSSGPAGSADISTPVAIDNASWDVKRVLGTAPVQEDGSAYFKVPARTPVFFQCLDEQGRAIQTMRSWSTLQPGETFACVGCHEAKNEAPPSTLRLTQAYAAGARPLDPAPESQRRGFSYLREVQPIWDRHCVSCHRNLDPELLEPVPSASHCPPYDTLGAMTDGDIPRNSDDHSIRRFTWHPRTGEQWAQLTFPEPREIGFTRIYWFDDSPRKGQCHRPQSWTLSYQEREGGEWLPVETQDAFSVDVDRFVEVSFKPVRMKALRVNVTLRPKLSGGILEWQVSKARGHRPASRMLDLTSTPVRDFRAGRDWARSYLNLTRRGKISEMVNWISSQSVPSLLPPRSGGSSRSRLLTMLREGHHGVRLTEEELRTVALWIDLACVYCGDYREANCWNEPNRRKYDHYERKRHRLEALERVHREALVERQTGQRWLEPVRTRTNLAVNPYALSRPGSYPRATSNSECRGERAFRAANAIDGRVENRGHGNAFPSWGPEQIPDPWLKIDFGQQVTLDEIDVWLRADFPHDGVWERAVIEFSDGSRLPIELRKTADRQAFAFEPRQVSWFRLTEFQPSEPRAWRAISEVEAWGTR